MNLKAMTRCALFAALLAVCSWLWIPLGDGAVTMQTLGIFLTLGLLGGRKGCAAIFLYLCLGAVGLPVFSGFQGGFGVLLGPTGGYLWGFLGAAVAFWLLEKKLPLWANAILCQLIIYACGLIWYAMAYGLGGFWLLLTYLLPDGVKIAVALTLVGKIKPHM